MMLHSPYSVVSGPQMLTFLIFSIQLKNYIGDETENEQIKCK